MEGEVASDTSVPPVSLTYTYEQTVCKVGNGFDDAALKQVQKELRPMMKQIHKNYDEAPSWLDINRFIFASLSLALVELP